jgi:hypothetical protein
MIKKDKKKRIEQKIKITKNTATTKATVHHYKGGGGG